METSNSPELAPDATTETASPVESSAQETTTQTPAAEAAPKESSKPASLKEAILSRKGKEEPAAPATPADGKKETPEAPKPGEQPAPAAAAPKYEPNFKFKAFGKEKEIPELFRGLVKDAESEKQVREVFTRAEAFDDMKAQKESISQQHQNTLRDYTALDRDVRRLTGYLHKGDFDNFFAGMKISDSQLFQYLQQKAQFMQDPALKAQYEQSVQQRAQQISQQEEFEQMQSNYQTQAVQTRAMQLDMLLARPDISSVASAWDTKAGEIGAFREMVTQLAANHYYTNKQDLSAEQAVQMALQRYGKFVAPAPQAQVQQPAPVATPEAPVAPQAPQTPVVPAAKPVIPIVNGKGTSPVKQVPKSLDDLKRMRKELERAENMTV